MYVYVYKYLCMHVRHVPYIVAQYLTSSHSTLHRRTLQSLHYNHNAPIRTHTYIHTCIHAGEQTTSIASAGFGVRWLFFVYFCFLGVPSMKTLLPAFLFPVPSMSPFQPTAAPAVPTTSTAPGKKISKVRLFLLSFLKGHPPLSFSTLLKFSAITKSQLASPNSIHSGW